jgi:hypothetical protein
MSENVTGFLWECGDCGASFAGSYDNPESATYHLAQVQGTHSLLCPEREPGPQPPEDAE